MHLCRPAQPSQPGAQREGEQGASLSVSRMFGRRINGRIVSRQAGLFQDRFHNHTELIDSGPAAGMTQRNVILNLVQDLFQDRIPKLIPDHFDLAQCRRGHSLS